MRPAVLELVDARLSDGTPHEQIRALAAEWHMNDGGGHVGTAAPHDEGAAMPRIEELLPHARRILFGAFWLLLFAFGSVRMLLSREWGYAAVCAAFVAIIVFGFARMFRVLAPRAEAPARDSTARVE